MHTGVVQNLLAFRDTQEACALFKGLGSQLRHLFQLASAGEGAVLLPIQHDVFGGGTVEAGDLLQQTPGGSVDIHADCVDAILHHSAQCRIQLLLGAIVLILPNANGLGVNFYQLGQRVLEPPGNGHGGT